MRVAVRADASTRIGSGHVMRCLTLAQALREQGAEVRFICRDHPGHMGDRIKLAGLPVSLLRAPPDSRRPIPDGDYAAWLGVPIDTDAAETISALDGWRPDWLVVDHYGLDRAWEQVLRPHVGAILVIDDLANRAHDCDLLLDQNDHPKPAARYDGLVPAACRRLCGPGYALLRSEYAATRRQIGPRDGPVARVLVYYGATDPTNETARALRVLSQPAFRHLLVDVVLGVNAPHRDEVVSLATARPGTTVHEPRPSLADLMARADLALGAGGATTWERCCLGLPAIVTAVAANQGPLATALAEGGRAVFLGCHDSVTDDCLSEAVRDLLAVPAKREAIAQAAFALTDGWGAAKVAEIVVPSDGHDLALRPAEVGDMAQYYFWVNDPSVRAQAFETEPVPWPTHRAWFRRALDRASCHMHVLELKPHVPVGQVRIEQKGEEDVIDYSVDAAMRGRGWGTRILVLARQVWDGIGQSRALHGYVKAGNVASQRAFVAAGFTERPLDSLDSEPGSLHYVYVPENTRETDRR
ncbi:UDP-2,4-diacetamido-2,4,6-trideoxy-beta-L-altropyranose hydrolase [uncultured Rhodospira sp.]|uniref:UDP-2,4-diacetamido-2,4, 6-trideoxy-beta-L-altropyranose hydrolase n=1 Tax=uncultured Rhodospira sp. TaxID=1936189 RepID=UPI002615899C|nr:UDP-2,4-diacetamido-2,4,6-trideoxy-beta-L-altropyranose hydrolase [uncultured Rhodospira sp.]